MLVELENYYKSLQDKKSEIRLRVIWLFVPTGILGLVGYYSSADYSRFVYLGAAAWGFVVVQTIVYPLTKTERAFEKVCRAIELAGHQENPSTKRKLRRLLNAVLDIPGGSSDPLLPEGKEERKKMDELVRRRLLPAARAGGVREVTLEMLAQLIRSPSLSLMQNLNDHLSKQYSDVEEATLRRRFNQLRASPPGILFEALAKSLLLGFVASVGAAYIWATALGYPDLATYLNANPTFATAIFSFAGLLTVGLFSYFRRK